MNYCIEDYYVDKDFVNVVRHILKFIEGYKISHQEQFKFKDSKERNQDVYYEIVKWLDYVTDPDHPEHANARKKFDFVNRLEILIACIATPTTRKNINDYYNAMMTSYVYSLRNHYTNEDTKYPYKSDNVVDLLEEIEQIKNSEQKSDSEFIAKPFVIDSHFAGYNTVYMPRKDVWTNKNGDRMCVCVHMCPKFQTYPTLQLGIKQIHPANKCIFSGRCHGSHIFKNGEFTEACITLEKFLFDEMRKKKER